MNHLKNEFNKFIRYNKNLTPEMIELHPELQEISTWIDVHEAYMKYKKLYMSEKTGRKNP